MWRTNVIHHKDYYSKNGSHTCIEDVFRHKFPWCWANCICRTKRYSAHQTPPTQNGQLILVKRKDKTILSVIQPEKETSHLWGEGGAEGICGKINRLVRKRTGQAFFIPLFGLRPWESQRSSFLDLSFPICKLKELNFKIPFSTENVISMAARWRR